MNGVQFGYSGQNLAAMQPQPERPVSLDTIREDLVRRIERLNGQVEKFEVLRAENEARLAELAKLGGALAALADPPVADTVVA